MHRVNKQYLNLGLKKKQNTLKALPLNVQTNKIKNTVRYRLF
jgi:hypothetical protein